MALYQRGVFILQLWKGKTKLTMKVPFVDQWEMKGSDEMLAVCLPAFVPVCPFVGLSEYDIWQNWLISFLWFFTCY